MKKVIALTLGVFLLASGVSFAQAPQAATLVEVENKICPVSGEKVGGSMGEGVKYEYNGKIYNLCCPACKKDFKNDPEKFSQIAEDEVSSEKK
jgi:YHS domain-containing protein